MKRRQPKKMIDESAIATNCDLTQIPPQDQNIDIFYNKIVGMLRSIQEKSLVPQPNHSQNRISESTRQLLTLRRETSRSDPLFHTISELCREELARDHQEFAKTRLVNAAMARKKRLRRTENPPPFLPSEIRAALRSFPNGKSAGEDKITADFLKKCTDKIILIITHCFNLMMEKEEIPKAWKTSKTILIFKKGDRENLENYRPITILPVLYKLFTKCILQRIRRPLEESQPVEQAGFRRSFSTMDHISTIQRILEASREHQIPLVLIFVDYHKAFDSVEPAAVWNSLKDQGVDQHYIKILQKCYEECSTNITPFFKKVEIPISKGVRQGDPISPNLFSASIEGVFRSTNWSDCGISIDGRKLNHLRFADDVVLISHTPHQASRMLKELVQESA
ncbi:unnamed protein product [Caenorhabditis angaria]|uniref:Reverse transcriptase domain-containing protein n=1 Tax=Caenorhabditis angaria TaxID=860376 RepID=A0A9P1J2F0_9PELO|nr:unnamed protein product [Caenorhabditis angaria]